MLTSEDLEEEGDPGIGGKALAFVFGLLAPVFLVPFANGGGPVLFLAAFVALGLLVGYTMLALSLSEGMIFGLAMFIMSYATLDMWVGIIAAGAMLVSLARYGLSDEDAVEPSLDEGWDLAPDFLREL